MAGTLPITAHIHKKQLSIFGMICRLPDSILYNLAKKILMSEPDKSKSWFIQIRHLCSKYNLPSPLSLLSNPPSKSSFKSLVTLRVLDFWQAKLRADSSSKSSLSYFNPSYMSLSSPHPLWLTCSSNSFEVNKATIQATFVSGRYISDFRARHWNLDNPNGYCLLCPGLQHLGTLQHLLLDCAALNEKRLQIIKFWMFQSEYDQQLLQLLLHKFNSPPEQQMQFLLDPSTATEVVLLVQAESIKIETVFYLTRTWCYGIHRRRQQISGRLRM